MGKIVITRIDENNVLFLFDDNHNLIEIKVLENSLVNSVYVGKIVEINQGLSACFVSISKDCKIFLPLSEFGDNMPKCGDEIIVQIKTDALKTKLPQGTLDICIPGEFCVLHFSGHGINASKKIDSNIGKKLIEEVKNANIEGLRPYRTVLRTNCSYLLEEGITPLLEELRSFISLANDIKENGPKRTIYSLLYKDRDSVISAINDISFESYDTIVTDNTEIFETLKNIGSLNNKTIKFHDDALSLINLYSLKTHLLRVLDKKVYLSCGGYLVIEPTEAMTVIDVNSGKFEGKHKETEKYIFKVNKEAAVEIARQLKLRNISGMIMVDFINMADENHYNELMNLLNFELNKDRIRTRAIDITKLGLVEITRKKVSLPLDKAISL